MYHSLLVFAISCDQERDFCKKMSWLTKQENESVFELKNCKKAIAYNP